MVFDTGAQLGSFVNPDSPLFGPVPTGSTVTTTVPNVMSLYVVAGTEAGANQYVYDPAHGGTLGFNSGAVPYRYDAVLFDAVTRKIGLDVDAVIRPAYKGELARSSSRSAAKAGEGWRRLG